MPEIPLSPIPHPITETTEGSPIDPNNVGNTERAISRFSSGVSEVMSEIIKTRKHQEDDDFATQSYLKDERDLSRRMLELQYETPADGTGFTDKVKAFAQDRLNTVGDSAPSDEAKRLYYNKATTLYSSAIIKAELHEADARNKAFGFNWKNQTEEIGKSQLDIPDHQAAMHQWETLDASLPKAIATKRITPAEAAEYSLQGRNIIAKGLADGYYNSEQYNQGLAFLLGQFNPKEGGVAKQEPGADYIDMTPEKAAEQGFITNEEAQQYKAEGKTYRQPLQTSLEFNGMGYDGKSPLVDALTVQEKDHYIKQYKKAMLLRDGERVASLNAEVEDKRAALISGRVSVDQSGAQDLIQRIQSAPSGKKGGISDLKKAELIDNLVSSAEAADAMTYLSNSPRSQWPELRASIREKLNTETTPKSFAAFPGAQKNLKDPTFNERSRMRDEAYFDGAVEELKKRQEKDAALFTVSNTPGVKNAFAQAQDWRSPQLTQNYASKTLNAQADLEIPASKRRVLPVAIAAQEARFFQNAPNGDAVVSRMNQLRASFGPYFTRVWGEISGKDSTLNQYNLLKAVESPESQTRIVDTIRNSDGINAQFKAQGHSEHDLDVEYAKQIRDFSLATLGGSRTGNAEDYLNSIEGAVKLEAKRQLTSGQASDSKDAITNAYGTIIGANNQVIEGGRSKVVAPVSANKKLISAFLVSHEQKETLANMDIAIPPGVIAAYKNAGVPGSEWKDRWNEQLSKRARWVGNRTGDGVRLVYDEPGYGPIAMTSSTGEEISFTHRKIISGKFPTAPFMYNESKGFFEKLFKGSEPVPTPAPVQNRSPNGVK